MTEKAWRQAYEGQVFIGTAGSTAATQISNRTKCEFTIEADMADATVAEDDGTISIKAEEPVAVGVALTFDIRYDSNDTNVATLINAAAAGTAKAVRTRRFPTSGPGFDGDVYIKSVGAGMGDIKEGQMVPVVCSLTRRYRKPSFNT